MGPRGVPGVFQAVAAVPGTFHRASGDLKGVPEDFSGVSGGFRSFPWMSHDVSGGIRSVLGLFYEPRKVLDPFMVVSRGFRDVPFCF